MGAYRVYFDGSVVYLPGHPRAQRIVTMLEVRAPSEEHAKSHALRTTIGGLVTRVEEVEDFVGPPPAPEAAERAAISIPKALPNT